MARTEVVTREQLIETAARILAEAGLDGLSTRRLANELGVSTMVVYTRFGSKPELLDAVVAEGFARQAVRLEGVAETGDPAADLVELGMAYRANAVENPHLYSIMYDGNGEDSLRGDQAKLTADLFTAAAKRVVDAGMAVAGGPEVLAQLVWSLVHGWVGLELAGVVGRVADPESALRPALDHVVSRNG